MLAESSADSVEARARRDGPYRGVPVVSVLVVTRNRLDMLRRCVRSVISQRGVPAELIVLDNNSREPLGADDLTSPQFARLETDQRLLSQVPEGNEPGPREATVDLRLLRVERDLGVASARNYLMAKASGSYFVLLDDDAELKADDALLRVVNHFEESSPVAALALCVKNVSEDGSTHPLVPIPRRDLRRDPTRVDSVRLVSYFIGAGHALRRSALVDCGDFEESFIYGEEELELSYRLIAHGFQIRYAADIDVAHYPQPSLLGRRRPELFHHIRNRFVLAKRYIEPWRWPIYLGVWQAVLLGQALRSSALLPFAKGWGEGISAFMKNRRYRLDAAARSYLEENHGRLWY